MLRPMRVSEGTRPHVNQIEFNPFQQSHAAYNDFDIIFGPVTHASSALYRPARAVWCALLGDHDHRML